MSKIRSLRFLLNGILIILLTLAGQHFYAKWQKKKVAQEIIELCELPPLPEELEIIHASHEQNSEKAKDLILSLTGPDEPFDDWMGEVDKWQKNKPAQVINFTIRESDKSIRVDFTAEVRLPKKE